MVSGGSGKHALDTVSLTFLQFYLLVKKNVWPIKQYQIWLLAIVSIIIAVSFSLPTGMIFTWINSLDTRTSVVSVLCLQVVFNIFCIPSSIFAIFSGFKWGLLGGSAISWLGSSISMALCYPIGRLCIRNHVRRWALKSAYLCLLFDNANNSSKQIWWIIFLVRISPVAPLSVMSYIFTATECSFLVYILASVIGIIPSTFLFIYLGKTVETLYGILGDSNVTGVPDEGGTPSANKTEQLITISLYLSLVILSTGLITYYASRILKAASIQHKHADQVGVAGGASESATMVLLPDLTGQNVVCVELDDFPKVQDGDDEIMLSPYCTHV